MAASGDTYTITLNKAHLEWGTHRHTNSRGQIYGEGYIPIPAQYARSYSIHNSNHNQTGLGFNEFNCTSTDGYFNDTVKAAGCSSKGSIYAKNLEGSGNLQAFGKWFSQINAKVGDSIEVTWTSSTDIKIRHY